MKTRFQIAAVISVTGLLGYACKTTQSHRASQLRESTEVLSNRTEVAKCMLITDNEYGSTPYLLINRPKNDPTSLGDAVLVTYHPDTGGRVIPHVVAGAEIVGVLSRVPSNSIGSLGLFDSSSGTKEAMVFQQNESGKLIALFDPKDNHPLRDISPLIGIFRFDCGSSSENTELTRFIQETDRNWVKWQCDWDGISRGLGPVHRAAVVTQNKKSTLYLYSTAIGPQASKDIYGKFAIELKPDANGKQIDLEHEDKTIMSLTPKNDPQRTISGSYLGLKDRDPVFARIQPQSRNPIKYTCYQSASPALEYE